MTYDTAFREFGELDVALPEGFEDCSRYDDGMPSFAHRGLGLLLMIDYLDPARRLVPGSGRFTLLRLGPESEVGELIMETDHYTEILENIRLAA